MFRRLTPLQAAVDVSIALVFFVVIFLAQEAYLGSSLIGFGLGVGLGFRRFSPAVALAIAWLSAIVQMFLLHNGAAFDDFAIVAILYATALYGTFVVRRVGFISVFIGGIVGALYLSRGGVPTLIDLRLDLSSIAEVVRFGLLFVFYLALLLILLGLPWVVGNLVRTRSMVVRSQSAQALAESEAEAAEQEVIVEQERNRIARDMHDVVAHSLAVVIAQADGARYAAKNNPAAVDEALTTISATAREALGDVRLLLGQLRHAQSEGPQPALEDLERLLEQLRASGLRIVFDATGSPLALGTGHQLAVYRIVQEALINVLRHGDVSHDALVHFEWAPNDLEVTITSSISTQPATGELRVGHGLAGMKERAALVGGRLSTEVDDRQFVVRAYIPATGVLA